MSTDNLVEPDAEDYDESEESHDIKAQAVSGKYIEPDSGQDSEVPE